MPHPPMAVGMNWNSNVKPMAPSSQRFPDRSTSRDFSPNHQAQPHRNVLDIDENCFFPGMQHHVLDKQWLQPGSSPKSNRLEQSLLGTARDPFQQYGKAVANKISKTKGTLKEEQKETDKEAVEAIFRSAEFLGKRRALSNKTRAPCRSDCRFHCR
jgi:hypothetical protein